MSAGTKNIKRKRGAQPGNKNAVGNRGGAPFGNRNAWKHGGYSNINLFRLALFGMQGKSGELPGYLVKEHERLQKRLQRNVSKC